MNNQIGIDIQMPFSFKVGMLDKIYESKTLLPRDKIVKIIEIKGLFIAL